MTATLRRRLGRLEAAQATPELVQVHLCIVDAQGRVVSCLALDPDGRWTEPVEVDATHDAAPAETSGRAIEQGRQTSSARPSAD